MFKCRICYARSSHNAYRVKENMFGLGKTFSYFQCDQCGCLQIAKRPVDMRNYYPEAYYSYEVKKPAKNGLVWLKSIKDKMVVLGGFGRISFLLGLVKPPLRSIGRLNLGSDARIIDVGCGSGTLLRTLKSMGFKCLLGVDPYIPNDIDYGNGVKILSCSLEGVDGKWDVVMFHHSFEHLWEPKKMLEIVFNLLEKGGACIIRVPTVSSYAWRHYRENWVQIDAPRHFFIYSIESMRKLGADCGFLIEDFQYDSTAFQFWGSELYAKGISLLAPDRTGIETRNAYFTSEEIKAMEINAQRLNAKGEGDQVAFIFGKQ